MGIFALHCQCCKQQWSPSCSGTSSASTDSTECTIFVACMQVTGLRISGTLRLIPIPELNLITFSFAYPPQVELKVGAAVGYIGGQLGKFGFLKRAITNVLGKRFTEPRRRMLAQYVRPAKYFNILQMFNSASVDVAVMGIGFPATSHRSIVVHAQMRKV